LPNFAGQFAKFRSYPRVLTGQEKLEKVRKFVWSGKVREKYYYCKVMENDLGYM